MEPHDAVPGRAMDALDSRPRRRDQGVCIFGWFPPTSEAPGWDEPGGGMPWAASFGRAF